MARHHRRVLSGTALVMVLAALLYPHLASSLVASDYSVTGSDSAQVAHLLQTDFSAAGAEQDVIVFDSRQLTVADPGYRDAVGSVLAKVRDQPGVVSVLGPTDPGAQGQISADQHAALATVGLSGSDRQRGDRAKHLQDVVQSAAGGGPVQAYLTGYSPTANDLTTVENHDVERAESIGIPIALVVLLVALAAAFAAVIPLLTALVALLVTFGILSLLTAAVSLDAFVLSIVTMIGVGISIDYSLFILSRFREELAAARSAGAVDAVPSAVGRAMATSGRTILFSGTIVMISLLSLFVVEAPLFRSIALGAVLVVACTLLTAWTMLPATLGAMGDRVNRWQLPRRWRPAGVEATGPGGSGQLERSERPEQPERSEQPERPSGWARWANTVLRHPWLAIPALAVIVLAMVPTFGIKLGIDLGVSAISEQPSGKAVTILADSFSPGVLSPIEILASHQGPGPLDTHDLAAIDALTTALAADHRVAAVSSITTMLRQAGGALTPDALTALEQDPNARAVVDQTVNVNEGSNRTVITAISKAPVDSTEASDLVRDIRSTIIPRTTTGGPAVLVGGETAQFIDLGDETLRKLPWVMTLVLSFSFLYLMVVFRSLLVPAKAVVMNLLATGATFGLTTWVFQGGHLAGLFGFTSVGFIQVYLPIMVFALLFGLSMDYEVFLVGRMHEQWLLTHDNDDAVATGVARTARPITAAALIMAAVFGCFLVADVLELKEFGFALAVAVALDATLVRLVLVPAFMKVAGGSANWWVPRWLGRVLPRVRLD